MGGLPKMITTPPPVPPRGPVRSHLKVVTKTEAVPYGGGRHWSALPLKS